MLRRSTSFDQADADEMARTARDTGGRETQVLDDLDVPPP
jgi:hypothetical protein